jgi:hypothetical protein
MVLNEEKARLLSQQSFYFVSKEFELYNLILIRDRIDLVKLNNEYNVGIQ